MTIWKIINKKADFQAIRDAFSLDPITIRLLVNRGITTPQEARRYLYPEYADLHSPFRMKGMEKACEVIRETIQRNERIRIIGDYDADGVFSTYIFLDALTKMGATVDYRIPERERDGYGINDRLVREAAEDGISLILTCDNGVSAKASIALSYSLGMKVIITDHHELPEELPHCEAILNPKQSDCNYPFRELCGAGVAMKLTAALGVENEAYLGFAAVATVCDVVMLKGENRTIVKLGLPLLRSCQNIGFRALVTENQIAMSAINEGHIGFRIGPCINACGRLSSASLAMELLLTQEEQTAARLSERIVSLNEERKEKTQEAVEKAVAMISEQELLRDTVLVLFLRECHESIAGIVAGRIRELYNRPTLVLTQGTDCVKGSARSTEYYNIIERLRSCSDLLLHFGGHPRAAGLSLDEENIAPLRVRLNEGIGLTPQELEGKLMLDLMVPIDFVSSERIDELRLLEPYGQENPSPLFGAKEVAVLGMLRVGREKSFWKLFLSQNGVQLEALYFGDFEELQHKLCEAYGEEEFERLMQRKSDKVRLSIAYRMELNEYMGVRTPQLILTDYRLSLP